MDSKRIQKNMKTLQNIVNTSSDFDGSELNYMKLPSKIKQQCRKESLSPAKLDFEDPHYIYKSLSLLLGGQPSEYLNYIKEFQRYISDNSNLFELCLNKCNLDYDLGEYIETLEERSVDDIFEFIFLLSLFPTINCFENLNCEKCKSLCSGYIDQCNNQSTCICRKSQIMLLRVLYEKEGILKQKNLPIVSNFKGTLYEDVEAREKVSVYIHCGKIVPLIDFENDSSSEESIDLIKDECEDDKDYSLEDENMSKRHQRLNATSPFINKSFQSLLISQPLSKNAQTKINSTIGIQNFQRNGLSESSINHTFSKSRLDESLSKINLLDGRNQSLKQIDNVILVPCNHFPPPGFELQNQPVSYGNSLPSNIFIPFSMNAGGMISPQIGYPHLMNPNSQGNLQRIYSNEEMKQSPHNNTQKQTQLSSMNKNSRVFRPKASNIQKSFRENMLNKTQIHEEDRSIMNKSQLSEGDSESNKDNLKIENSNSLLSQSMIQGRISPLNLDASRFEKEEASKEVEAEEEIVKNVKPMKETSNFLTLPIEKKKIDPSISSASPNSNHVSNSHNDEENENSFIINNGEIFNGIIKFFNSK